MLMDKRQKTSTYLFQLKTLMDSSLQAGNIERAVELGERLRDLYERSIDETR